MLLLSNAAFTTLPTQARKPAMRSEGWLRSLRMPLRILAITALLMVWCTILFGQESGDDGRGVMAYPPIPTAQRMELMQIARDTWGFYAADVDPSTHLPMDNFGANGVGRYTSASNIGVYLWAVVAANDLGLVSRPQARALIRATLTEVQGLRRYKGFLFQWYDTTTGDSIRNPGDIDCATETAPTTDNCFFVSAVDNGWYASGLIVARQALPELAPLVNSLLGAMDFSIFYDNGVETDCNVNAAGQPTGQMFGGYYAGIGPAGYHNGAFYSDPRIAVYIGMGLKQMPGNVWWKSWRALPPPAPYGNCAATDPNFSWQGQWPMGGYWQDYADPQSHQVFHVWEGHYRYPGTELKFVPTWAGGMFEGLMANEVVPETSWGPRSFGLNDARTAQVQIKYATEKLHLPVWGMSPSSTADDTGGYGGFGVEGLLFPYFGFGADTTTPNDGLSQCFACATEDVVSPHTSFLALDVVPQEAFANIQSLRSRYPDVYGQYGFYDAVNPTTAAVGHRYLVLDQSMIMAALDNALNDRAMQRHFAQDPVAWAAQMYLGAEALSIR
ncbi:DUF3131 domain-containing protein [Acidobacteria bacterium AB60]|nr:DUF3131 domain-containing protein [Acidobacteria bacterium AB60]